MTAWVNDDGLAVRFGLDQSKLGPASRPTTQGEIQQLVIDIVAVDITDVDVAPLIYHHVGLPQKAHILRADLYVTKVWTVGAGAASLDIGLYHDDGDGTYTVLVVDGIDEDIALTALDSVGAEVSCDGSYLDGTDDVVPSDSAGRDVLVSVGYQGTTDTHKYTAGEAKLVIQYIKVT